MRSSIAPSVLLALAVAGSPLLAQQHEHTESPYAHSQSDDFPTLSPEEVAQLQNGEGMGLARPAELNHFPGPKHVLELAEQLGLSAEQAERLTEIRERMSAEAVQKGLDILRAEKHLGELFAGAAPTLAEIQMITGHVSTMRGELQAIHLGAHLETTELLTPTQVEMYDQLRGYREADSPTSPAHD